MYISGLEPMYVYIPLFPHNLTYSRTTLSYPYFFRSVLHPPLLSIVVTYMGNEYLYIYMKCCHLCVRKIYYQWKTPSSPLGGLLNIHQ